MNTRLFGCAVCCLILSGFLCGATAYGQAPPPPTSDPTSSGSSTSSATTTNSGTTTTTTTTTTTLPPPPTSDPNATSGTNGSAWNMASLEVHAAINVLVSVSPGDGATPVFRTSLINPTLPGSYLCSLVTNDNLDSLLVNGAVTPDGDFLVEMHRANALMLGINSPLITPELNRSGWTEFWDGYWYYATHPSAMDTDLEYGYYAAMGTAVVTGTTAGSLAITPYIWSAYMSAAATEMFTISWTIPPATVFAMEGVGAMSGAVTLSWTVTAAQLYTAEAALLVGAVYMTGAPYGIDVNNLAPTNTVAGHAETRPYINSPLKTRNIMQAGTPVPDAYVPGALRWEVPGWFSGSYGIYELVIDPVTMLILHYLFRST